MAACPNCQSQITPGVILRSPLPVWITCPKCGAKLVGDRLVKLQGLMAVPIGILVAWFSFRFATPEIHPLLVLVLFATLAIGAMTYITLKWGSYRIRFPN